MFMFNSLKEMLFDFYPRIKWIFKFYKYLVPLVIVFIGLTFCFSEKIFMDIFLSNVKRWIYRIDELKITIHLPYGASQHKGKATVDKEECVFDENKKIYLCKASIDIKNIFEYTYDGIPVLTKYLDERTNSYTFTISDEHTPLKIKSFDYDFEKQKNSLSFKGSILFSSIINNNDCYPPDDIKIKLCNYPIQLDSNKRTFHIAWEDIKYNYHNSCQEFLNIQVASNKFELSPENFSKKFYFVPSNKSEYEFGGKILFAHQIMQFIPSNTQKTPPYIILQKNIKNPFELKFNLIKFNSNDSLQLKFIGKSNEDVLKIENLQAEFNSKSIPFEKGISELKDAEILLKIVKTEQGNKIFLHISGNQGSIVPKFQDFYLMSSETPIDIKIEAYTSKKNADNKTLDISNITIKKSDQYQNL